MGHRDKIQIQEIRTILNRLGSDLSDFESGAYPHIALDRLKAEAADLQTQIGLLSYVRGFNSSATHQPSQERSPLEDFIVRSFCNEYFKSHCYDYMTLHVFSASPSDAIVTFLKKDDATESLKSIPRPPEGYILAALDLAVPFEDQWPHAAGSVTHEIQLIENPVIHVLQDELKSRVADAKAIAHLKSCLGIPHLRPVCT